MKQDDKLTSEGSPYYVPDADTALKGGTQSGTVISGTGRTKSQSSSSSSTRHVQLPKYTEGSAKAKEREEQLLKGEGVYEKDTVTPLTEEQRGIQAIDSFQWEEIQDPSSMDNRQRERRAYYTTLAATGNTGKAFAAMYNIEDENRGRFQRNKQKDYLLANGYTPESIQQWIKTDNKDDLATQQKRQTQIVQTEDGPVIMDMQTGEILGKAPGQKSNIQVVTLANGQKQRIDVKNGGVAVGMPFGPTTTTTLSSSTSTNTSYGSGAGVSLSAGAEKEMMSAYDLQAKHEGLHGKALALAQKIDPKEWTGGWMGNVKAKLESVLGSQDEQSALRTEYTSMINTGIIDALPEGVATDTDIRVFSRGFPTASWSGQEVQQWLYGKAKVEAYLASQNQFKGRYLGQYGSLATQNNTPYDTAFKESNELKQAMELIARVDEAKIQAVNPLKQNTSTFTSEELDALNKY